MLFSGGDEQFQTVFGSGLQRTANHGLGDLGNIRVVPSLRRTTGSVQALCASREQMHALLRRCREYPCKEIHLPEFMRTEPGWATPDNCGTTDRLEPRGFRTF
jgi:hypothetical protein